MRYRNSNSIDKKFKVMVSSIRCEIMRLLYEKPLNAGEIAEHFTVSFASISYHLRKLEESGLVISERTGKNIKYMICNEAFEEIYLWLVNLIAD